MALTEDNSNATLEEANTYHADRLNSVWAAATDIEKSAALIRATDYIAFTYTLKDGIERTDPMVKQATIALAPFALSSNFVIAAEKTVIREKGDGIGEIEYSDRSIDDPYPAITRMLAPVAMSSTGGFRSVRVIR